MNWNFQPFRSLFVKSQQPKRPISDANNFVMFYDTKDLIPNDIYNTCYIIIIGLMAAGNVVPLDEAF